MCVHVCVYVVRICSCAYVFVYVSVYIYVCMLHVCAYLCM